MAMADEQGKKRRRPGKLRLGELRCFLLAATLLLGGISVLHTLSSTQLTLTSETDYRRLSFFATVRPRQEDTDAVPSACESLLCLVDHAIHVALLCHAHCMQA